MESIECRYILTCILLCNMSVGVKYKYVYFVVVYQFDVVIKKHQNPPPPP